MEIGEAFKFSKENLGVLLRYFQEYGGRGVQAVSIIFSSPQAKVEFSTRIRGIEEQAQVVSRKLEEAELVKCPAQRRVALTKNEFQCLQHFHQASIDQLSARTGARFLYQADAINLGADSDAALSAFLKGFKTIRESHNLYLFEPRNPQVAVRTKFMRQFFEHSRVRFMLESKEKSVILYSADKNHEELERCAEQFKNFFIDEVEEYSRYRKFEKQAHRKLEQCYKAALKRFLANWIAAIPQNRDKQLEVLEDTRFKVSVVFISKVRSVFFREDKELKEELMGQLCLIKQIKDEQLLNAALAELIALQKLEPRLFFHQQNYQYLAVILPAQPINEQVLRRFLTVTGLPREQLEYKLFFVTAQHRSLVKQQVNAATECMLEVGEEGPIQSLGLTLGFPSVGSEDLAGKWVEALCSIVACRSESKLRERKEEVEEKEQVREEVSQILRATELSESRLDCTVNELDESHVEPPSMYEDEFVAGVQVVRQAEEEPQPFSLLQLKDCKVQHCRTQERLFQEGKMVLGEERKLIAKFLGTSSKNLKVRSVVNRQEKCSMQKVLFTEDRLLELGEGGRVEVRARPEFGWDKFYVVLGPEEGTLASTDILGMFSIKL